MDVARNIDLWNSIDHWETGSRGNNVPLAEGEKWSRGWGSSEFQWASTLLPRVQRFLPTGTILEIACGRGRWSQYLKNNCDNLILQDIASNCVDYCRDRFADESHISYLVGTGSDLPSVADASVDFVFSFDSLVHADLDVMLGYVRELGRVLAPGGNAFLHHSNFAACDPKLVTQTHLRDPSTSAQAVIDALPAQGLSCTVCELLPWVSEQSGDQPTDALLTLHKGPATAEPRIETAAGVFEVERAMALRLSKLYGS